MAVIYVCDLEHSVSFYTEVLGLRVTDQDPTAALLGSDGRSPLVLRAMGDSATRAPGSVGVECLVWAASGKEDLERADRVLRRRSAYVETRQAEGYTVVEGRDPDTVPVLLAYPTPDEIPLHDLPARVYAW
jgi:catechol 2,3-dioxygenase-like lactoylglutathione lyase family enzyme